MRPAANAPAAVELERERPPTANRERLTQPQAARARDWLDHELGPEARAPELELERAFTMTETELRLIERAQCAASDRLSRGAPSLLESKTL